MNDPIAGLLTVVSQEEIPEEGRNKKNTIVTISNPTAAHKTTEQKRLQ